MARHDVLTGLPNRAVFVEALQQAIAPGRPATARASPFFISISTISRTSTTPWGIPIGDLAAPGGRATAAGTAFARPIRWRGSAATNSR